jgi:bifunctional non-homologous end joining protein LigD
MWHRICRQTRSTLIANHASALQQAAPPFCNAPEPERERVFHWLTPGIVAQVSFLEWTPSGEVRHPVYQAHREAKAASAVSEEKVLDTPTSGVFGSACEGPARLRPPRFRLHLTTHCRTDSRAR